MPAAPVTEGRTGQTAAHAVHAVAGKTAPGTWFSACPQAGNRCTRVRGCGVKGCYPRLLIPRRIPQVCGDPPDLAERAGSASAAEAAVCSFSACCHLLAVRCCRLRNRGPGAGRAAYSVVASRQAAWCAQCAQSRSMISATAGAIYEQGLAYSSIGPVARETWRREPRLVSPSRYAVHGSPAPGRPSKNHEYRIQPCQKVPAECAVLN